MAHDAVWTRAHDGLTAISLNADIGREESIDQPAQMPSVGRKDHAKRDGLDVIGQIGRPMLKILARSDLNMINLRNSMFWVITEALAAILQAR